MSEGSERGNDVGIVGNELAIEVYKTQEGVNAFN